MKNKITSIFIGGVLVTLFLSACGGGGNSNNQTSPTPQTQAFTAITETMLADGEDALPVEIADEKLEFDADNNPAAFDSFLPDS
jgi:hypothetical protein